MNDDEDLQEGDPLHDAAVAAFLDAVKGGLDSQEYLVLRRYFEDNDEGLQRA